MVPGLPSAVRRLPWLLAATVALSRLLLLPDGPWEQDEAIFAAGVLDYSVVRHRPHPPGFPGWIALGKLALPVVGDPLLALRLWSCLASVAGFVLGSLILRRFVAAEVAWAASFAHAFVPGVWFHAPRAFSTTPALALVLLSIWLWLRPGPRSRALGFVTAAAAVLVRPQLLAVVGVVGVGAAWYRRDEPRVVALGVAAAAALVTVVVSIMVVDTGGLDRYLDASLGHLKRNQRAAQRFGAPGDLGLVRDLGGLGPATLFGLASVAGLVAWARRDRSGASWIAVASAVALASILTVHPPGLPRYGIVVVMCAVPLVAMLADTVGRSWGASALALVAAAGAWSTFDAVLAVRNGPLPVVAALRSLATEADREARLVHSHGLFAFVRLDRMRGQLARRTLDEAELVEERAEIDGPYDYLGGRRRALPGATVGERLFDDFPPAAWDLSQRRFHRVHLLRRPVVVESPTRAIEHDRNGEPFVWLAPRSRIRAQPGAERLVLVMLVDRELAPLPVSTTVGGRDGPRVRLEAGLQTVVVPLDECEEACAVGLAFGDRLHVDHDPRSLSARLYGAWCEGPGFSVPAFSFSPGRPRAAAGHGVMLEGFYAPERFTPEQKPGAWTRGHARVRFPGGPGRVTLQLAQPPPRASLVTLRTGAGTFEVIAGSEPTEHTIEVRGDNGIVAVDIEGAALAPASYKPGNEDDRPLGPIVLSVSYEPRAASG